MKEKLVNLTMNTHSLAGAMRMIITPVKIKIAVIAMCTKNIHNAVK
jgi:hypothetical protein